MLSTAAVVKRKWWKPGVDDDTCYSTLLPASKPQRIIGEAAHGEGATTAAESVVIGLT